MRWFLVTAFVALAVLHAAGAAELSATEQAQARKLYNAKCARCHKFYDPARYSDAEWQQWMTKMNKKARVKGAQAALLGRYLDSFRTPGATNAAPATESVSPGNPTGGTTAGKHAGTNVGASSVARSRGTKSPALKK